MGGFWLGLDEVECKNDKIIFESCTFSLSFGTQLTLLVSLLPGLDVPLDDVVAMGRGSVA